MKKTKRVARSFPRDGLKASENSKSQNKGAKSFSLVEQYRLSFKYLGKCKNFIYLSVGVFLVFALIGYFVPAPVEITEMIKNYIQELLVKTQGMGARELVGFIFFNNLQVSFFGVIFGAILGIIPIIYSIANGYMIGFVLRLVVGEEGIRVLLDLIPHGIFELPAIFISLGLGMKFGTFIFQKEKGESFRNFLWNSLRVFLFIVVPLLVIAAIIEGILIVY